MTGRVPLQSVLLITASLGAAPGAAGEREGEARWEAFRPPVRPPLPELKDDAWPLNPIDRFVAREREARGLEPAAEAPPAVLLRRVYLDLTGLPPSREELRAFLDDPSPAAYEQAVDRLLASPHYGERWGRHWMDIWRYSDWAGWGNQVRDSQPHIWRWRDWIVESLNRDKPYDRMVLEMLAGDEIAPEDPGTLRATGFLVRNFKLLSREMWMQDTVNHTARAFLGVTLECARCHDHRYDPITQEEYYRVRAIFEPHNVRIDRVPGQADAARDGLARVYDAEPEASTFLFIRGDDRQPDKGRQIRPGLPALLGGPAFEARAVDLPLAAHVPDKRDFVVDETRAAGAAAVAGARAALEKAELRARAAREAVAGSPDAAGAEAARSELQAAEDSLILAELDLPLAEARLAALEAALRIEALQDGGGREREPTAWEAAAIETTERQRQEALLSTRRGRAAAEIETRKAKEAAAAARAAAPEKGNEAADPKLAEASKKAAAALEAAGKKLEEAVKASAAAEKASRLPPSTAYRKRDLKVYPAASTGRRTALARWIADRTNPLAARVAANHIWGRHFGAAIVPTVYNFGASGRPPSNPELLDWLAVELMEPSDSRSAPWSMKRLHRLIVTSRTYRMSSAADAAAQAIDPENRWLWRMPARRLEAELVRDAVLHVAGRLDLTLGGPELDQQLGLTTARRSLYYRHAAEKQMVFLKVFDAAAPTECYQRKESLVPQQALALSNSELAAVSSRVLARLLAAEFGPDPAAFAAAAFEQVLARSGRPEEIAACVEFLDGQERLLDGNRERLGAAPAGPAADSRPATDPGLRAREGLVHALMNHHDFVTVR